MLWSDENSMEIQKSYGALIMYLNQHPVNQILRQLQAFAGKSL